MPLQRNIDDRHVRERCEDAAKHLLEAEQVGLIASIDSLAGAMQWTLPESAEVLSFMRARGLALAEHDGHRLTEQGRELATEVVRSHRLYETWLAHKTGVPAREWHALAHRAEHVLRGESLNAMADGLGNPRFDPHGDPIPTREGQLPDLERISLAEWDGVGEVEVVHVEDEPAEGFQRLHQLGVVPGVRFSRPQALGQGGLDVEMDGRLLRMPGDLTLSVHVRRAEPQSLPTERMTLAELAPGHEAVVHGLAARCTGSERTRMLDLGLVPGTRIRCEFTSPFGFPRSYLIRGAMVALRKHQASQVWVIPAKL